MHSKPQQETPRSSLPRRNTSPDNKTVDIVTFNVGGVKGNASTLIDLARSDIIICLQEIWLWTFEDSTIDNLLPNYESFVRCDDLNENIPNFQVPRGKAGVATMWPKKWSNNIKRLEDGNERIITIELNTLGKKILYN